MREIRGIQYLRGVAATMVVLHHAMVHAAPLHFTIGAAGVDLFFVISGFIMWFTTKDSPPSPARFMEKRALRVIPLYWLATLVTIAVYRYDPKMIFLWESTTASVIRSMLFYPHAWGETFLTTVNQGWTLCYEMFFYLIFAGCLLLKTPRVRLCALLAIFAIVTISHRWTANAFTSPIIVEFMFGVLIAAVTDRLRPSRRNAIACLSAGTIALIVLNALDLHRVLAWGMPAALIVLGVVWLEKSKALPHIAILRRFGDASYSIYIWHMLAFSLLMLLPVTPIASSPWIVAAKIILALGIGTALHGLVERPLTAALRHSVGLRMPLIDRLRRARAN